MKLFLYTPCKSAFKFKSETILFSVYNLFFYFCFFFLIFFVLSALLSYSNSWPTITEQKNPKIFSVQDDSRNSPYKFRSRSSKSGFDTVAAQDDGYSRLEFQLCLICFVIHLCGFFSFLLRHC